ncbi:MAG: inositol monophosphatase family protein [Pseudomonadota bacterium]
MHPMLNIAVRAARRAGTIISRSLNRLDEIKVDQKGHQDFVTQVDKEAEAAVIDTLLTAYPDHAILAEESGSHGESNHVWVIDPLDGTTNFVHGYPQFAVSIALLVDGIAEQAVIYDPCRDELFTASKGVGAQLDNRKIRVSRCRKLNQSLLATGFPVRDQSALQKFLPTLNEFLTTTSGIRRAGAAALDLAYVACGRIDGFWEFGLQPWDIAAGALIVQEAGGIVSTPLQQDDYLDSGDILAATPAIHTLMSSAMSNALKR